MYVCRCVHATVNSVGCLSWTKGGIVLRWLRLLFLVPHPLPSSDALEKNQELEFERNKERFLFLKWGAKALKNMLIVPPGSGIVHQVEEDGRWERMGGGGGWEVEEDERWGREGDLRSDVSFNLYIALCIDIVLHSFLSPFTPSAPSSPPSLSSPPPSHLQWQVNLEYLARVVFSNDSTLYPDSLVGTDSHTTMINGLGVLGWGVGGIEAEAVMLGQAISMVLPEVVGYKLVGSISQYATSTDVVLTITKVRTYWNAPDHVTVLAVTAQSSEKLPF